MPRGRKAVLIGQPRIVRLYVTSACKSLCAYMWLSHKLLQIYTHNYNFFVRICDCHTKFYNSIHIILISLFVYVVIDTQNFTILYT